MTDHLDGSIEGEHVPYEVLESYVDDALSAEDRAAVESHFAACAMCREEAADLRTMVQTPRRGQGWMWAAAAVVAIALAGALLLRRQGPPAQPPPKPVPIIQTTPLQARSIRDGSAVFPIASSGAIEGLSPSLTKTFDALRKGIVPSRDIVETLRGRSEGVRAPLGVVEDPRPVFRWTRWDDASYVVEVYDAKGQRVAQSTTLRKNEWRPEQPLPRGDVLTWRVIATGDSEQITAPFARFKIIGKEAADEIETGRARDSHLIVGLVYAREGMIEEATAEMVIVKDRNPDSPEITRALNTLRRF